MMITESEAREKAKIRENLAKLEPELFVIPTETALCSIAISLRRLADHFEREEKRHATAKAERKDRNERLGQING